MSKSPVVYSKNSSPVLAWFIHGEEPADEPHDHRLIRVMARGAVYGLVESVVRPSGLMVLRSTGNYLASDQGLRSKYTEFHLEPWGDIRTSDHLTAEMRDALAIGWQESSQHFEDVANESTLPAQAKMAVGQLIVPRPDDTAPIITGYMPKSQPLSHAA